MRHTVRIGAFGPEMFRIPWAGGEARVIGIIPGQIVTDSLVEEPPSRAGEALADPERDLAKIAVVERHLGTGRVGLGFVRGFGLERGALASTRRARRAQRRRRRHERRVDGRARCGGSRTAAAASSPSTARRCSPSCRCRSRACSRDAPLEEVVERVARAVIAAARTLGCTLESPFQHLAFLALSVIPSLKLTDRGLVDVDRFELVPLEVA